ncbi:hypothetical protein A7A09_006850 [Paracoccus methylarcula]|uniref:Uncharacterized protein n=2 Tax=Paracoccus methylarcula TaxID=72022 RepID=A0A3R7LKV2_9RHOB|nr:hypothetical protein A7A09_006850 [Paracoccus methylarcula]
MTVEELFLFTVAGVIAFFFWQGRKQDRRRKTSNVAPQANSPEVVAGEEMAAGVIDRAWAALGSGRDCCCQPDLAVPQATSSDSSWGNAADPGRGYERPAGGA